MKLGKFWVRTVLFLFTLPFFYALLFLLPHRNYLAFNLGVMLATVGGAIELESFYRKKGLPVARLIFPLLSGTLPLVTYLEISGIIDSHWWLAWLTALTVLVLLRTLWIRSEEEVPAMLQLAASSMLVLIYPALSFTFLVRLTTFDQASWILLFFFCLVFINDIMAYLAGKFFGRHDRFKLLISPNKTGVGFMAGFLSSIVVALVFRAFLPGLLSIGYAATALFGAGIGLATILGDLVESALKRSARVKDSSAVIPGRGGVLDSVDSLVISAPLYYFFLRSLMR